MYVVSNTGTTQYRRAPSMNASFSVSLSSLKTSFFLFLGPGKYPIIPHIAPSNHPELSLAQIIAFMPVSSLQNKRAEKLFTSLPLVNVVAAATPLLGHKHLSLTLPALSPCCPSSPKPLALRKCQSAVIGVNVYHFQRGVKSCQGFGFTLMG